MSMLNHALHLAGLGFHVFPLVPGLKIPAKDVAFTRVATRDPAQIRQMWSHGQQFNVGVYTGRFGDDPQLSLCVLDVDDKERAKPDGTIVKKRGSESLFMLEMDHALPPTFEQVTASGGRHLVFLARNPVACSVDKLGSGLDVRGTGGFIVGAGSLVGGREYTAVERAIAEAPASLIELCGRPVERDRPEGEAAPQVVDELDSLGAIEAARAYLRAAPRSIKGAGGDATAYRVAARVKDFGLSQEKALELMMSDAWNDGCGWAESRLSSKIEHAYRYGRSAVGASAPEVMFSPVAPPIAGPRARLFTLESARATRFFGAPPPPQRYAVDPLLPAGRASLLVAPGGVGKSMLTLQIAVAIALGRPLFGRFAVEPGAVLILAAEDDEAELHRRLSRICEHEGVALSALTKLYVVSRVAQTNQLVEGRTGELKRSEFARFLAEDAREIPGLSLIVCDPLSRFRAGVENDSSDSTAAVESFEFLAAQTGAAALAVHHASKAGAAASVAGQSIARGSSALVDGVRSVLTLRSMSADDARRHGVAPEDARLYVELAMVKANYARPIAPLWLRRTDAGVLDPVELAHQGQVEARSAEKYTEVMAKVRGFLATGVQISRRDLERLHGGTAGHFGVSAQVLRSILVQAVAAGDLAELPTGFGRRASTLNLPSAA